MSKIIQIPLTKGKVATIDVESYELVSQYKWHTKDDKNGLYYAVHKSSESIRMHRLVLGLKSFREQPVMVDHIDHDGLNNIKSNLRIVTQSQNMYNKRPRKTASSKFKGVYWNKDKQRWTAEIRRPDERRKHIGHFKLEIEAAIAYNTHAVEVHGEYACLNIIDYSGFNRDSLQ